eukprot:s156_g33.t1
MELQLMSLLGQLTALQQLRMAQWRLRAGLIALWQRLGALLVLALKALWRLRAGLIALWQLLEALLVLALQLQMDEMEYKAHFMKLAMDRDIKMGICS